MGTPWRAEGVRTSVVHRYGTVERSVKTCRVPSRHRVPTGFRWNFDLARWGQSGLDGSLDCPESVHD